MVDGSVDKVVAIKQKDMSSKSDKKDSDVVNEAHFMHFSIMQCVI